METILAHAHTLMYTILALKLASLSTRQLGSDARAISGSRWKTFATLQ
ncbi:hypothetical protein [Nostoc flagelliforme]|nr:hypothetical protein [Nostoc flagelliforme]